MASDVLFQMGGFMTQADLQSLLGQVLDSRFRIERMVQNVGSTSFCACTDLNDARELLLRIEGGDEHALMRMLDRFREAAFLSHPNLITVSGSGGMHFQGTNYVYVATEMPATDLSEALQQHPMDLPEIGELLKQVIAALQYLHSENLIYCALRAGSVWRVGGEWKLADYSQLRIAGKYAKQETRPMMLMPGADAPPEANQGVVSEAWDIWALGSMLRKTLLRSAELKSVQADPDHPVPLNRISIPPPFDRILRELLDPDPAVRSGLDKILNILADRMSAGEGVAPPSPAQTSLPSSEPAIERVPAPRFSTVPQASRPSSAYRTVMGVIVAALTVIGLALVYSSQTVHSQSSKPRSATHEVIRPIPAQTVEPAPAPPQPSASAGDSPASTQDVPPQQRAIASLLDQWVNATRARDLEQRLACYAPLVDRYYGQRSLPVSRLRSQEKNVLNRIGAVRKFEISNLKFHRVGPQWAVVSFDKAWEFGSQWAGSAREEMVLRPVHGEWKIASQRELKVYWMNKQSL